MSKDGLVREDGLVSDKHSLFIFVCLVVHSQRSVIMHIPLKTD